MRTLLIVGCVLAMASPVRAQSDTSSWENLNTLQAGERINVVDDAHKKHTGTLASVTDQAIMVHGENGDETIQRGHVMRVDVRGHGHRARNAAIGAGIGAGAGAGIGAAGGCSSGCFGVTKGATAGVGAALGALVGTIAGALIPSGNKAVYRAHT